MSEAAGQTSVPAISGDYNLNLTSESTHWFREALQEFLRETEADSVALIEHSGAILMHEIGPAAAGSPQPDPNAIGVLAAGMFGSTQMLAQQLGEQTAPEVFCHGAGKHFFCCPVSETFALLTIFGDGVAVGVVRLNAHRAAGTIQASLKEVVKSRTGYGEVDLGVTPGTIPAAQTLENPFLRYN
ncbi:MAG: putative regulator of Ras-like GTPase activity (Roadblock/LC7/MglB family) [Verrucomicrobiales bacterium]|jgi:predicted regulator of Ras-like GTPase activity (Roadblock/LC7/MglB family)